MVFCGFVRWRYGDSDAASQNPNTQGWCPLQLKHTFLAVTTVFAALLCLSGCGSDSGSSVLQRDVKGIWSFYEIDDSSSPPPNPLQDLYTPLAPGKALAYDGFRNRPVGDRITKNLVLQLTNVGEVSQICDTCGQAVGGSRLYGKFISINNQFLCTPDLDLTEKPIMPSAWMRFYGTLEGTQVEATVTGSISQRVCSRDENEGLQPGPDNCAGLGFSGNFQHPVEMHVSGELQWEPFVFGLGFCKLVFTYDKVVYPNQTTWLEAPAACNETGEFVLYKSGYQPTDTASQNCATAQPPVSTVGWSQSPNLGGCGDRDAYRWGPIAVTESECLDTYVSE